MTIVCVNEITIFRVLVGSLLGRPCRVLAVEPFMPQSEFMLERVVKRLVAQGGASMLIDEDSELAPVRAYPVSVNGYDLFARTEAWQRDYFRFPLIESRLPEYVMAVKAAACNLVADRLVAALVQSRRIERGDGEAVIGISDLLDGLAKASAEREAPGLSPRLLRRMVNMALAAVCAIAAAVWAFTRFRPGQKAPQDVFFAADFYKDTRDVRLYDAVQKAGPQLMVVRSRKVVSDRDMDVVGNRPSCARVDGIFGSLRAATASAWLAVRDVVRIYAVLADMPIPFFYRAVTLPWKRITYRALFNRYRPRFFWGRDPYNPDHVIRRQELNRVGGESFGLLHGFGALTALYPMFRYISYDRIFLFGGFISDLYRDTWDPTMKPVVSGTFSATSEVYTRLHGRKGGDDIVVMTSFTALENNEMVCASVRALAAAFPERKILLQVKPPFPTWAGAPDFIRRCCENVPNVISTEKGYLDLLETALCVFTDPSSVFLETLQFRVPAFVFDLGSQRLRTMVYRDRPIVCVSTPAAAVERVRSLETGSPPYPWAALADLTDFSGREFSQIVAAEMGVVHEAAARAS